MNTVDVKDVRDSDNVQHKKRSMILGSYRGSPTANHVTYDMVCLFLGNDELRFIAVLGYIERRYPVKQ